jgi:K+-sensing histidine kinase KdpD
VPVPEVKITAAIPLDAAPARALILQASSLARRLNVGWNALLVQTRYRRLDRLREKSLDQVRDNLELVVNLGGSVVLGDADDVASTIVDYARREAVELLVIGRPRRGPFLRRLAPGTAERILAAAHGFDVLVVDTSGGVPA